MSSSQKPVDTPFTTKGPWFRFILLTLGIISVGFAGTDSPFGWIAAGFAAFCIGLIYASLERVIEQRSKLEGEATSFPAQDFIQGMNAFGVETTLGGAAPEGEWAPDIRLRFPVTVLHKHLVDSMVEGYRHHSRRQGKRLVGDTEMVAITNAFETLAWRWIEEMTQGRR